MGALFQAVSSQLGNLGSGIAEARDARTTAANELAKTQAEQQQRMREFAEQQKMDTLTTQVQQSLMKSREAGAWNPIGSPMVGKDGSYSIIEHNSATGEIRARPLPPDVQPQNEDEIKWDQYRAAYKKAFSKEPPEGTQEAFFNKLAGVPEKTQDVYQGWREAFKAGHGRYPNADEIYKWHRDPKADASEGGSDLDDMAQAVSDRSTGVKLPAGKLGVQVLGRMKKLGLPLPAQLSTTLEDRLMQRADALDLATDTIERIKPNLPLLKSLPAAALVNLAQHSDTVTSLLTRLYPNKADQITELAADLRTLQEQINIIRGPLGATGFRGKEGWTALQNQAVRALQNPAINAITIQNSEDTIKRLRDSTLQILGTPADTSPSGPQSSPATGGAAPKPGGFHKDPKTGEMVED